MDNNGDRPPTPEEQAAAKLAAQKARVQAVQDGLAALCEKHRVVWFVAPGQEEITEKGTRVIPLGQIMYRALD